MQSEEEREEKREEKRGGRSENVQVCTDWGLLTIRGAAELSRAEQVTPSLSHITAPSQILSSVLLRRQRWQRPIDKALEMKRRRRSGPWGERFHSRQPSFWTAGVPLHLPAWETGVCALVVCLMFFFFLFLTLYNKKVRGEYTAGAERCESGAEEYFSVLLPVENQSFMKAS